MNNSLVTKVSQLAGDVSKEILLPNFAHTTPEKKDDGSWLTIADTKAHERLTKELPRLEDYPVLSEEMSSVKQQQILDNKPASYWCIDPLDGTSNFTQGIPYWCCSIALIIDGKRQLGVVYDPNRDECFTATSETQTMLNGQPLIKPSTQHKSLKSAMGLIDLKRLSQETKTTLILSEPYASQRSFGASALDLCWIAASRCHIYLHGKLKLWDYAAGLLILEQAGGFATTFERELVFNNDLESKAVIAACNEGYFNVWTEYLSTIRLETKD